MQGQTNRKIIDHKLQRTLRNAPTNAEQRLWQYLRDRQLDGCKFRRQHPFGDFILDFAFLDRRIAIELDGSQHDAQQSYDAKRADKLRQAGFVVLRFWNNQVLEESDGVLEVILQTLRARATPSPPSPPLEGEG